MEERRWEEQWKKWWRERWRKKRKEKGKERTGKVKKGRERRSIIYNNPDVEIPILERVELGIVTEVTELHFNGSKHF